MKLLLDTQMLLWAAFWPELSPPQARQAITDDLIKNMTRLSLSPRAKTFNKNLARLRRIVAALVPNKKLRHKIRG